MAAVVVEAVGVVAGVLGIAGFVENNLPAQTPKGSTVRVAVGLNGKSGLSGADGDAPSFQAWNENQETIGLSNDGQKIKSGGFVDIFVDQMATGSDHSTEQPTYLQIGAGNDAVCIAYVSVTQYPPTIHSEVPHYLTLRSLLKLGQTARSGDGLATGASNAAMIGMPPT